METKERTIYGVRDGRTHEIIRVYAYRSQADEFVAEWLEDGGKDIYETVKRKEIVIREDWESLED